ncbi:hypothetical protein GCK72_002263 [Caenorhabditis remanei]|uniref:Adenylyl cyclase-associated protein n=1 Tax=Caenorhabditis remanei TaxID=31234 RepID=E3MGH8_CAERE|nr:hypothetical protein GCK72_002263 [Caenorhabditis remanei]EFP01370.1 CRE-CAS-2 protein [Caenorhabditis remanei]KAF1770444.1 hypothetical protein GCK72_002263 [Caenorhabditis remanei]
MDPSLVSRIENFANRMENILKKYESTDSVSISHGPGSNLPKNNSTSTSTPQLVKILDNVIHEKLVSFLELSAKIDIEVDHLGGLVKNAFTEHRHVLWTACGMRQPEDTKFADLINELSKKIIAVSEYKVKNRNSKFSNHLSAVEAAVGGLGWVAQPNTPAPFINDALDMSMFYINRIFMAHKDKTDHNFEWAKTLKELLTKLHGYVAENHVTGLVWNSEPGTKPTKQSLVPVTTSGAPPPPPPPQAFMIPETSKKSSVMASLLESLNTGLSATKRLKKITPDMQTHKNPALRAGKQVMKEEKENIALTHSKPGKTHDPIILWDGKIWRVEHLVGNKNAVVEVTEMKEAIYIFKCTDSIIKIKGKANSITLDRCHRTFVVFDGLVGPFEVINSQSIEIQTLGDLLTVSIQQTDGCNIFLSRDSLKAKIIASKSSAVCVSAQLDEGDDEYKEMAVPDQFMTQIVGKKLVTTVSEIV